MFNSVSQGPRNVLQIELLCPVLYYFLLLPFSLPPSVSIYTSTVSSYLSLHRLDISLCTVLYCPLLPFALPPSFSNFLTPMSFSLPFFPSSIIFSQYLPSPPRLLPSIHPFSLSPHYFSFCQPFLPLHFLSIHSPSEPYTDYLSLCHPTPHPTFPSLFLLFLPRPTSSPFPPHPLLFLISSSFYFLPSSCNFYFPPPFPPYYNNNL